MAVSILVYRYCRYCKTAILTDIYMENICNLCKESKKDKKKNSIIDLTCLGVEENKQFLLLCAHVIANNKELQKKLKSRYLETRELI